MSTVDLLRQVRERPWFYEFDLPDGTATRSYLPADVARIHTTRLAMLWQALGPVAALGWDRLSAIDLACHQGYFATHIARKGCREVVAVDARSAHIADTTLMAGVYGLSNLRTVEGDVATLQPALLGTFDVTLMLGLLYHVENPVGALRLARALTRRACVIETQVTPNMTGIVDWGACTFQHQMVGSFALIDETAETHAPEASITGICLCPSYEALLFVLAKVGFSRVVRVMPPEDGHEQLASGKRVMVVAHVD